MSAESVDTQRLFFALWPASEVRERLAAVAREHAARPVLERNLHLTLVFLGECSATQRACFSAAASAIESPRFSLSLDFLGGRIRTKIQWLASSETPQALRDLVEKLHEALGPCGFEPERRRFLAHVTLSRKARKPAVRALADPVIWPVDSCALMVSEPAPGGVRYRLLECWPLANFETAEPGAT